MPIVFVCLQMASPAGLHRLQAPSCANANCVFVLADDKPSKLAQAASAARERAADVSMVDPNDVSAIIINLTGPLHCCSMLFICEK